MQGPVHKSEVATTNAKLIVNRNHLVFLFFFYADHLYILAISHQSGFSLIRTTVSISVRLNRNYLSEIWRAHPNQVVQNHMFWTRWHRVPQLNYVWAHKHACIHMLGKDKFDHSFICTCINTNTVKGQKSQDSIKQVNWHFRRDLLSLLIYLMNVEFAKERRTKTEKSNSIFVLLIDFSWRWIY